MAYVVNIEAKLAWTWSLDRESKQIVAVCEPLKLVTHGADVADLQASINDTLNMLFKNLLQAGELDQFLHDRGWTAVTLPDNTDDLDAVGFNVPIHLVAAAASRGQSGQARKAH